MQQYAPAKSQRSAAKSKTPTKAPNRVNDLMNDAQLQKQFEDCIKAHYALCRNTDMVVLKLSVWARDLKISEDELTQMVQTLASQVPPDTEAKPREPYELKKPVEPEAKEYTSLYPKKVQERARAMHERPFH